MDYLERQRRLREKIVTQEAIHTRMVAARLATGKSAKQLAENAGITYSTFKTQEYAGSPSLRTLDFYWKAYQIDPNYIMGGDAARIPADVLEELLKHLDDPEANT